MIKLEVEDLLHDLRGAVPTAHDLLKIVLKHWESMPEPERKLLIEQAEQSTQKAVTILFEDAQNLHRKG